MTKPTWDYNIWTGDSILTVSDSKRIIRMSGAEPYIYYAEDWANYPDVYRSPCGSIAAARKWLKARL